MIFSIEGNIGSGKSTIVKHLQHMMQDDASFVFVQEPVDTWEEIKDDDGVSILANFYKSQKKFAFPFQMMAYISRLALLRKVIRENPGKHIICERSVYTDRNVFAKMLKEDGKITKINYTIYNMWFNEFLEDVKIDNYIYIKASPIVCCSRINNRNRSGEEGIPVEYLQRCGLAHDDWLLNNNNNLVLDVNQNVEENPQILQRWMQEIKTYIESKI
tara:strand:+ start:2379 stop:3026 length:648 start_codon:yes stop_codon:yes gene_type:complete